MPKAPLIIHSEPCGRRGGGHLLQTRLCSHDRNPIRLYELVIHPTRTIVKHRPWLHFFRYLAVLPFVLQSNTPQACPRGVLAGVSVQLQLPYLLPACSETFCAHILSVVLRQFSRPVAIGLLAGVGGAAALSQILRRQLYGISNLDLITDIAAIGFFIVTAAVASLWPARRALRVDPIRALRYD